MIENDRRLRLVDLRIDVAKLENVRLHRFGENLSCEFEDAFLVSGRCDYEADWKIIRSGKRRRHDREHLDPRNRAKFGLNLRQISFGRGFSDAPRFQNHSAKSVVWECKLKCEARVGNTLKDFSGSIRVTDRVVDGR